MNDPRPFLEIPLPSPREEQKLYEEWLEKKKEEEEEQDKVVIIEL